ncbi:MucB/RseB C-terminal domain-containing protein [Escherichia coli]
MQTLAKANLPPLLSVPVGEKAKFSWTPTWLPQGFSEVSSSRRPLPTMDDMPIESRLYSDGLFSFSVNVNRATPSSTDTVHRTQVGVRSVRDNAEITVGELPPQTAKRIAENISSGQRNDQRVGYRRLLAKRAGAGQL